MAKWPYNTTRWQKLRRFKLATDPLCAACRLRGRIVEARVVDHMVPISAGGDAFPALDGLQALCARCHNEKTSGYDRPDRQGMGRRIKGFDVDGNPIDPSDDWYGPKKADQQPVRAVKGKSHPEWLKPSKVPLTIVCGPPAAGKSRFVARRAAIGDLVIDLDDIAAQLSGSRAHDWDRDRWLGPALARRNQLLGSLSKPSSRYKAAWLIVSEPEARWRHWLERKLQPANLIVLEVSTAVCLERARQDPDRDMETTAAAITQWWKIYRRRPREARVAEA